MPGFSDRKLQRALLAASGYLELELPHQALELLRGIHDPGDAKYEFYRVRAEVYRALEQWHPALEDFQRCHAAQPTNIDVLLGLAWCYKRVNQLPKAIAAIHAAHRANNREPILLYNLACYYALSRNKSQALAWLGRALRMQRDLTQLIPGESDFDSLRQDPDFLKLIDLARGCDPRAAAS